MTCFSKGQIRNAKGRDRLALALGLCWFGVFMKLLFLLLFFMVMNGCATSSMTEPASTLTSTESIRPIDAVASNTLENRESSIEHMHGDWYLKQPLNNGGYYEAVIRFFPDSSYALYSQSHGQKETASVHVEFGFWGKAGSMHFMKVMGVGRTDNQVELLKPNSQTQNKIFQTLSRQLFVYEDLKTRDTYTAIRLNEDNDIKNHLENSLIEGQLNQRDSGISL